MAGGYTKSQDGAGVASEALCPGSSFVRTRELPVDEEPPRSEVPDPGVCSEENLRDRKSIGDTPWRLSELWEARSASTLFPVTRPHYSSLSTAGSPPETFPPARAFSSAAPECGAARVSAA